MTTKRLNRLCRHCQQPAGMLHDNDCPHYTPRNAFVLDEQTALFVEIGPDR